MADPVLDFIEQYVEHFDAPPTAEEILTFVDPRQPLPISRMIAALAEYGSRYHRRRERKMG